MTRPGSTFERDVSAVLDTVRDTLLAKNRAYGNSALEPVRIFSRADRTEQIRVRLDDKLARLRNMNGAPGSGPAEDTILDLIGYLVILKIAEKGHGDGDGSKLAK
jgi:hypothetical protein